MTNILDRYTAVTQRIETAAIRAGRNPDDVTLIAVSKTFAAEEIEPALQIPHTTFGENRVQESQAKWPLLKEKYPNTKLHLIGPLQTNKAREAVALFDCIETIDREKLARIIAKEMDLADRRLGVFIQVNTGLEEQKAGLAPSDTDRFVKLCRETYDLDVMGLMCIPPFDEDPRPHFQLLAKLAESNGLSKLSMGMSGDYEIAIECGATHVRVGSAIFGSRS